MSRGPDAATSLERALLAHARASGCPVALVSSGCTRWASATFAGMRHMLDVRARASSALDGWLAGLPEAEFTLRGHLVADLVIERIRREGEATIVSLEVLTVEER
jgi:hypothetical protein